MFLLTASQHSRLSPRPRVFAAEMRFPNTGSMYDAQRSPSPYTGTHWYSLVFTSPGTAGRPCPALQLVISSPCHGETSAGIKEELHDLNWFPPGKSPSYTSSSHLIDTSPPQQKLSSAFFSVLSRFHSLIFRTISCFFHTPHLPPDLSSLF